MNPWKKDYKKQESPEKPPTYKVSHDPIKFADRVRACMNNTDLKERLAMLKDLYHDTHGGSQPYVLILINKCDAKIKEQEEFIF